jgi:hypothetical protein
MKSVLFLCTSLVLSAQDEPKDTIRRFDGIIGENLAVSLHLSACADEAGIESYIGFYYDQKNGIPIKLSQQPDSGETLTFREGEHWNGEKDVFTGLWSIKLNDETLAGTWSSPEGKKSLPIRLEEAYPAGSSRIEVHSFQDGWTRKRDRVTIGKQTSVSFIQLQGDSPGIHAINSELRRLAWIAASDRGEDSTPPPPARVTCEEIEKATLTPPPTQLDWDAAYVETRSTSMEVVMNEHDLLCLSLQSDAYTGGAHGIQGISHITFDTRSGKRIKLSDWVNPGFEKRWADLGAMRIREDAGQKPDTPLTEAGMFEDTLALNENWFITPGGMGFSYEPYEIACYARGIVEFTLPWKAIAQDIKPGTPAAALVEKYTPKAKPH